MFVSSFCKKLLLHIRATNLTTHHHHHQLYVLQIASFSNIAECKKPTDSSSLTVDFLINSCGLSPEKALSTAKQIQTTFQSSKKPKSVINFLETTGFSKTHISKLISKNPRLLFSDVDQTLKPKIEVFQDLGLSGSKLADLLSSRPNIWVRSLKRQIIPNFELVRSFVQTDENLIKTIKRSTYFLSTHPNARIQPNIDLLKAVKVPRSRIAYTLMTQPGVLLVKTEILKQNIETVKRFGFKPETGMFTIALHVLCSMSKSTWGAKIELLKSLGWSEEQIFDAFRRLPIVLVCSEKKMKQGMEFYRKRLDWDVSMISKYPKLLMFSFETRIIPRVEVFEILVSKKMMAKKDTDLIAMFNLSEKKFLHKYVTQYQNEIPDLLNVYKKKKKMQ